MSGNLQDYKTHEGRWGFLKVSNSKMLIKTRFAIRSLKLGIRSHIFVHVIRSLDSFGHYNALPRFTQIIPSHCNSCSRIQESEFSNSREQIAIRENQFLNSREGKELLIREKHPRLLIA